MDQKKKMSKTTKVLLVIGGVAVVAAIVILILSETVYNANASAKNASNRAFDAAYNCRFDDFVEATIYNPDCMVELGLSLAGELYNEVKPDFETTKAYVKETDYKFKRTETRVVEYEKDSEGYKRGVELLHREYVDAYEGRIEKFARTEIEFDWSYRGDDGKTENGHDTDISWSICIDGKWYVVPSVDETLED